MNDSPISRGDAFDIAIKAAALYRPTYFVDEVSFHPHEWVIAAIMAAAARGATTYIKQHEARQARRGSGERDAQDEIDRPADQVQGVYVRSDGQVFNVLSTEER